jgi:hypothetical protein
MGPFQEWLGQVGLAHCAQVLVENGIDFDVAQGLTESDLRMSASTWATAGDCCKR